jgi:glycosyltransferase involved in cell wall biosynthesis
MPSISVIIPVYNGEKTIHETIESVLNQTLSDFEVIVINDGSQDSTLEIVSSIQDPRLKVISYPNAGLSVTRNRGISLASGDYIAFIDADDLWTPDKLESQFKALQANPQAAVAYSWTNHIDESSQFSRTGSHMTVSGNVYAKLLLANFLENGSNPLIRRQALTTVGGFDETLIAAEDWDMYLRLAAHYHFVAVPSPQILYRISIDSMSSNVYKQEKESVKVIKKAFIQAPKFLQHLKKQSLANLYKYLTFKTLEGDPERQRGIKAAHFLWHCIINDPSLLRKRVIWKVGFTIAVMALLSPTKAQALLAKSKQLANHRMLLLHMQLEPL